MALSPVDCGAVGDGKADDTAAFQAAIASVVSTVHGDIIHVPPGRYRVSGLTIDMMRGLEIRGASPHDLGRGTTILHTSTSDKPLFDLVAPRFLRVADLNVLQVGPQGGDIIRAAETSSIYVELSRLSFSLQNPDSSFFRASGGDNAFIRLTGIRGFMAAGSKTPAIDITSQGGSVLSEITLEDAMINASPTASAPIVRIAAENGASGVFGITLRHVVFEQPGGGAVELGSIQSAVLEHVIAADLVTELASPLVHIRKGSGHVLPSNSIQIRNCFLPNKPSIVIEESPGAAGPIVIGGRFGSIESTRPPIIIGGATNPSPAVLGDTTPLWLHSSGRVQGVRGLSSTAVQARNFTGTLEIPAGKTSGAVVFPVPEDDIEYRVFTTPVSPDGSVYVEQIAKTTMGFTVTVSSDSGVKLSIGWLIVR